MRRKTEEAILQRWSRPQIFIAGMAASLFACAGSVALAATPNTILTANRVGSASFASAPPAQTSEANARFEIDPGSFEDEDEDGPLEIERSGAAGAAPSTALAPFAGSATVSVNRGVRMTPWRGEDGHISYMSRERDRDNLLSFDGLTGRDTRLANGGRQFTSEPPDQGLCAGNGFVVESVNDAIRIYDRNGVAQTGVVDLNTFYNYPAAIDRTANPVTFGPFISDPSCVYDRQARRWFHVVLTIDRASPTSQAFGRTDHLDIAVSETADPRGAWSIFSIPVQNDGTQGTTNDNCRGGPCLGDYPQIAVDRNGLYITTNEFALSGPGFFGAQIYAVSKRALLRGASSVPVVRINTGDASIPFNGFTVWPAQSVGDDEDDDGGDGRANGTAYFMSSLAVFERTGTSNQILVWSLTNTRSLNSSAPSLSIDAKFVTTSTYGVPPSVDQKAGDFPLGQCLADNARPTPFGPGCWQNFFVSGGPFPNVEKRFDGNDSRMQQVYLSKGRLWGALDTAVSVGGETRTGILWFIVDPRTATVYNQGVIAVPGNNVTRPAIAATEDGKGLLAFTLSGRDYFPSAAYVTINPRRGASDIKIAALGLGANDTFSGYNPTGAFGARGRWGDYGAAAVDGDNIWFASEYIGQTCTLDQYVNSGFACGATRVSQANWYTRISRLRLDD